MSQSILLKGGIVLEHDAAEKVSSRVADILIVGNRIESVDTDIAVDSSVEVIDCRGKIISPGFIDTHRHTWQTQLKGRFADTMFGDYTFNGIRVFIYYEAEDVFFGQLAGALESIDAGTTTILDFDHNLTTPESMTAGAEGLIASGVRAVFCTGPLMTPKRYHYEMENKEQVITPWFLDTYREVATKTIPEKAEGRVLMGFNLDRILEIPDEMAELYKEVLKVGPHLTTFHDAGGYNASAKILEKGFAMDRMVAAHANSMPPEYYSTLLKAGVHFSSSPSVELQIALGYPICFDAELAPACGLAVDCHSLTSSSLVSEARVGLQGYRGIRNQKIVDAKGWATQVPATVESAFNLLTVGGARVMKMPDRIGSIKPGYLADLLVWDTTSPAMLAAAQHNPVAAVVLHSSTADLRHVIVDGKIRKRDGKLAPVHRDGNELPWDQVAQELLASRERIQAKIDAANAAAGKDQPSK